MEIELQARLDPTDDSDPLLKPPPPVAPRGPNDEKCQSQPATPILSKTSSWRGGVGPGPVARCVHLHREGSIVAEVCTEMLDLGSPPGHSRVYSESDVSNLDPSSPPMLQKLLPPSFQVSHFLLQ